ncbi:MAG TPA: dihydroorotase [Armatimonadota bacterium]|nr:dihydroorotase [Armatimonadota bacterium]
MSDLLIRSGRLFDPGSGVDGTGDLLLRGGIIAGVGEVEAPGADIIEADGLWVLPGLIDLHVHLREPGQEYKETIATGTRAAAAGGFAAVACEPNTSPPTDSPERLARVREIAAREAAVRVLPKCAITVGQRGEEVVDIAALRAAGAVAASDDGLSVGDADVMRQAFAAAKRAGLPLTVHVDGPEMVARDIGLSAEMDWPVHFSHVSLAEEVELIARARAKWLRVSGEATPHHLVLSKDDAPAHDARFKMNPPLGSPADRAAVRSALAAGVLTVIASDHAPHSSQEKARPYDTAPPGVIGLETTLAVIWTGLVHADRVDAATVVAALTAGPAAVLGIAPPALREGGAADITLFDPEQTWVVDPERFQSKARNCPFAGRKLRGKPVATIVGGRVVMREGSMLNAGVTE